MDDILTGALGICDNVKKVPSRGMTQIIIEVPIEYHKLAVALFDGEQCWLETAPKELEPYPYCVLDHVKPVLIEGAIKDTEASRPKPAKKKTAKKKKTEHPKGGPVSKNAAALCRTPEMYSYITTETDFDVDFEVPQEQECRRFLLERLAIKSRAELDHNPIAAERYEEIKSNVVRYAEEGPGEDWE